MRIGVIADSHDRLDYMKSAYSILKDEGINTLIHLGDYTSPFLIPLLKFKKVYAIFGNNDGDKITLNKKADKLGFVISKPPLSVELNGRRILMMHEPFEIESHRNSGIYDVILYGHTHDKDMKENPLTVNPGELCGWLSGKGSFAILDLNKMNCEFRTI